MTSGARRTTETRSIRNLYRSPSAKILHDDQEVKRKTGEMSKVLISVSLSNKVSTRETEYADRRLDQTRRHQSRNLELQNSNPPEAGVPKITSDNRNEEPKGNRFNRTEGSERAGTDRIRISSGQ